MATFRLNGVERPVSSGPGTTLLDHLRGAEGLTGTKEGCAEGDCGACTVVLDGRAVNACITLMGQVAGRAVTTVEGLRGPDGAADPLQRLLAETDGTQCGFCTPGFVMSLAALRGEGGAATVDAVHEALAGNLCRCTGYRPIVETALTLQPAPVPAPATPPAVAIDSGGQRWKAPETLADLLALRAAHPEAVIVAGATDLGLGPSRSRTPLPFVIDVGRVVALKRIAEEADALILGAAVTYTDALPALAALHPTIRPYLVRLGSRQIRNAGTIGGNLGNASPIGDMPPLLLALDAELTLASTRGRRQVAVADFFTGYRKTMLGADEVIESIRLPRLGPEDRFRIDKLSKRYDQDISTVAAAFRLRMDGEVVREARLAFGGMAATPVRARAAEGALTGRPFDEAAVTVAIAALDAELSPIGDIRASAAYRKLSAANLLRRFHLFCTRPDLALEVQSP